MGGHGPGVSVEIINTVHKKLRQESHPTPRLGSRTSEIRDGIAELLRSVVPTQGCFLA